ncbi:MAG: lysostaphin resistance A-like protein [Coriobacteriia bacterium]
MSRDATLGIGLSVSALFFAIVIRPAAAALALQWTSMPDRSRTLILDFGGLLVVIVAWICWRRTGALLHYVALVLLIPAFEEVLFRGYAWSQLSATFDGARVPLATLLVSTALFGLWHIGYADTLVSELSPTGPALLGSMAAATAVKTGSALILGLLAGIVRWRTGRVYGSFLAHAFWNLITLAP